MQHDPEIFTPSEVEVRFPYLRFAFAVIVHLLAVLAIYWWVSPGVFKQELDHGVVGVLFATFLVGLPLSLFEFGYHRYLLHSAVLPFLKSMNFAHGRHHGLTNVTLDRQGAPKDDPGPHPVKNKYAIEESYQEESMMFPLYSLAIFYPIFGILVALPLKLLFPGQPFILATLIAVTLYVCWYEIWHMIQHLPYSRFWKPLLYESRFQKMWRWIYNFHLVHHFLRMMNMAVVGFWGFAIWDHVFKTCYRMRTLPVPGARVLLTEKNDAPHPVWVIGKVDSWQSAMCSWSRRVEDWVKRFLGIKKPAA